MKYFNPVLSMLRFTYDWMPSTFGKTLTNPPVSSASQDEIISN